jgi:hypothetical protein
VPLDSAVLGLPGSRETVVGLSADHSNICRLNLTIEANIERYEIVRDNMVRLCKLATDPGIILISSILNVKLFLDSSTIFFIQAGKRLTHSSMTDAALVTGMQMSLFRSNLDNRHLLIILEILESLERPAFNARFEDIEQGFDGTSEWIWSKESRDQASSNG